MQTIGVDILARHIAGEMFQIKAIFNEHGIVFGPVERQHMELSGEGISYKPDGKGNALAAMIYSGKFEIRADKRFSEGRVRGILAGIYAGMPASSVEAEKTAVAKVKTFAITYGGKTLTL